MQHVLQRNQLLFTLPHHRHQLVLHRRCKQLQQAPKQHPQQHPLRAAATAAHQPSLSPFGTQAVAQWPPDQAPPLLRTSSSSSNNNSRNPLCVPLPFQGLPLGLQEQPSAAPQPNPRSRLAASQQVLVLAGPAPRPLCSRSSQGPGCHLHIRHSSIRHLPYSSSSSSHTSSWALAHPRGNPLLQRLHRLVVAPLPPMKGSSWALQQAPDPQGASGPNSLLARQQQQQQQARQQQAQRQRQHQRRLLRSSSQVHQEKRQLLQHQQLHLRTFHGRTSSSSRRQLIGQQLPRAWLPCQGKLRGSCQGWGPQHQAASGCLFSGYFPMRAMIFRGACSLPPSCPL